MINLSNKNNTLAVSLVSFGILLIFSTIAICSSCACSKPNLAVANTNSIRVRDQAVRPFEINDVNNKNKIYTMDVILYSENTPQKTIFIQDATQSPDICGRK